MKKFLYVIIGLVVIYFILAFIGPKHIDLSRQIEINKDKEFILEKLGDLQFFQAEWSPWTKYDPKMNKEIIGTPGSVGHQLSWKSEAKEIH